MRCSVLASYAESVREIAGLGSITKKAGAALSLLLTMFSWCLFSGLQFRSWICNFHPASHLKVQEQLSLRLYEL